MDQDTKPPPMISSIAQTIDPSLEAFFISCGIMEAKKQGEIGTMARFNKHRFTPALMEAFSPNRSLHFNE